MKTLYALNNKLRKRHFKVLKNVKSGKLSFVRGECSFRIIERLHRAGLLTACISKWNLFGKGDRPFRELAVFMNESEARARKFYNTILPR